MVPVFFSFFLSQLRRVLPKSIIDFLSRRKSFSPRFDWGKIFSNFFSPANSLSMTVYNLIPTRQFFSLKPQLRRKENVFVMTIGSLSIHCVGVNTGNNMSGE